MKEEMWRAFYNRRFWIVLALTLASLGVGWYRAEAVVYQQDIHPVNLLMVVLGYTPFSPLAALFATLPFADSFLDDRNHGFLHFIVTRTPYHKYLAAKSLAVSLAGGVSVGTSFILMLVLLIFTAQADFSAQSYLSTSTFAPFEPWGPLGWLYSLHPFYYLGFLLISAFTFGAVYSLMGLAVSVLVNNRYITLAAPLVFFQLFSYLEMRSLHLLPAWNPVYTLYPFEAFQGFTLTNWGGQYALLLFGSVLCITLFARKPRMLI
jgi:hypothetical protein